jgi:hypothetical protein
MKVEGSEVECVGKVDFPSYEIAFLADGQVLRRNEQIGPFQPFKRLRQGMDVAKTYEEFKATAELKEKNQPLECAYYRKMRELFDPKTRANVGAVIDQLADDPDGLWSTLEDFGAETPAVFEIASLCLLYKLALDERRKLNRKMGAQA